MTRFAKRLRAGLAQFAKNKDGTIAVETALILPLLLWAMAAMAIYFDVFRTKSAAEKASYTISDMLSRETNAITPTYVDNTLTLFEAMVGGQAENTEYAATLNIDGVEVTPDPGASLRLSVITWNETDAAYELQWSEVRGAQYEAMQASDMVDLADSLPTMADQDTVIVVESFFTYSPILNVGLGDHDIDTFVFTRPRYAPLLAFDDGTSSDTTG
ncbi:pilus assembly protein [Cognatishimia sp. SS12]|uniref:TadE/TadG family type IV pilus assembly protein n=1 Tax=Cognatishimia sp. SS12 TaxID=2979465 RepID=UPI00232AE5DC|nr:TadE/TadG family type IV pilus assembly protein [Cognatishimia sp. SS12]MDC0736853.1 pilus assembly protein [Cognatishimia sp. SS12]